VEKREIRRRISGHGVSGGKQRDKKKGRDTGLQLEQFEHGEIRRSVIIRHR
jgi:hypothetical protein